MKKTTAFTLFFAGMIILGCNKNDNPHPVPSGQLSVSRTAIRLDTTISNTDTFVVHSTVPWTATLTPSTAQWFQLERTTGGTGDTVVKITVLANNGANTNQTATITIAASNGNKADPVTISLTQKPYALNLAWQKNLGGSSDDGANALIKTADGGMAIAGYTNSTDGDISSDHGDYDFLVVKQDASGTKQWARTFGGSGDDEAYSIATTADGGYLVAGYTTSTDGDVSGHHGNTDIWVLKLDGSGNKQWAKTFGGSNYDFAKSLAATSDGGCVVAGFTNSTDGDVTTPHGGMDMWALKLDGSGNKQWAKTYGGTGDENCFHIVSAVDGGFLLAGTTLSNDQDISGNHGQTDMWVVKTDGSGNKQWTKTFGGSGNDYAFSVTNNTTGGFTIAGATNSTDGDVAGYHGGLNDILAVNMDGSGNKLWAKTLGGSGADYALSITGTTDGGFAIAGWTDSNDGDVSGNHGQADAWLVKLNSSSKKQWARAIGGTGTEDFRGIYPSSNGGYMMAGRTNSKDGDVTANYGLFDMWAVSIQVQ